MWQKYKQCRNHITYNNYKESWLHLKRSKYKYEQNIAENILKNPKGFWKYVSANSKTTTGIGSEKINGRKSSLDKEIAEEFNKHFILFFTI